MHAQTCSWALEGLMYAPWAYTVLPEAPQRLCEPRYRLVRCPRTRRRLAGIWGDAMRIRPSRGPCAASRAPRAGRPGAGDQGGCRGQGRDWGQPQPCAPRRAGWADTASPTRASLAPDAQEPLAVMTRGSRGGTAGGATRCPRGLGSPPSCCDRLPPGGRRTTRGSRGWPGRRAQGCECTGDGAGTRPHLRTGRCWRA